MYFSFFQFSFCAFFRLPSASTLCSYSVDVITNPVRGIEPSVKSISASGIPSPSVIAPGSRGLRLDDLLIGNVIQQCFSSCTTPSTTCPSLSTISNSTPGSTMLPVPGSVGISDCNSGPPSTNPAQGSSVGSQSKIIAAMREYIPEQLSSPGFGGTVSPKQSAAVAGPQTGHNNTGNYINVANSCTPYGIPSSHGSRTSSVSVSTANISIPGTFTQSSPIINPLLGSKSGSAGQQTNSSTTNGCCRTCSSVWMLFLHIKFRHRILSPDSPGNI